MNYNLNKSYFMVTIVTYKENGFFFLIVPLITLFIIYRFLNRAKPQYVFVNGQFKNGSD